LTKRVLRGVPESEMAWTKVADDKSGEERESESSERAWRKDEVRGEGVDFEALTSNVTAR
jgi:hypothetical protein